MALLKEKSPGLRICVWINPYIGDQSPVFEEAAKAGYLLKRKNGDIWQWDLWYVYFVSLRVIVITAKENAGKQEWELSTSQTLKRSNGTKANS